MPAPPARAPARARHRGATLGALVTAAALASPATALALEPRQPWRTLETEHLSVHFHAGAEALAARVAELGEDTLPRLADLFEVEVRRHVDIVVTDHVDIANGLASTLPYDTVVLFPTPPEPVSSLTGLDDWLRVLVVHELTRIVQLNVTTGAPAALNRVLGKTYVPNGNWPSWFVEGVAVYVESTRAGSVGRARSTFSEMMLSTAARAGRMPDLATFTNGPTTWPHGTAAYNFGGPFVAWLVRRHGEPILAEMSRAYGGRIIPFSVSRTLREATGQGADTLWNEWLDELRLRAEARFERIAARGLTTTEPLTRAGETHGRPRFQRDGSLLYLRADGRSRAAWMRLRPTPRAPGGDGDDARFVFDLDAPRPPRFLEPPETLVDAVGEGGATFVDGDRTLVVSRSMPFREFSRYEDLVEVDLRTGARRRLTRGARASEPEAVPGNRHVLFVQNGAGGTTLAVVDRASGETHAVLDLGPLSQLSGPRLSPDGRTLAFAAWLPGGSRNLWLAPFDPAHARLAGPARPAWVDGANDLTPAWTPDGRFVLFASDLGGSFDLHAYEPATARRFQLTNVETGAFEPAVSPDGRTLVMRLYGPDGFDLHAMPLYPDDWSLLDASADGSAPAPAPAVARATPTPHDASGSDLDADPDPDPDADPDADLDADPDGPATHAYRPFPSLLPRAWFPFFGQNGRGSTLGALTSGRDALSLHGWSLVAEHGLDGGGPTFDFEYSNRAHRWVTFVGAQRDVVDATGTLVRDGVALPYVEAHWRTDVSVTWPLTLDEGGHALTLGHILLWRNPLDDPRGPPPDAQEREPRYGGRVRRSALSFGWSYGLTRRFTFSISAEEGRRLSVDVDWFSPAFGGDDTTAQVSAGWLEFVPLRCVGRHHVLALALSTAAGRTDGRRRLFALGGPPSRDVVLDAVRGDRSGSLFLRGYAPGAAVGDAYALLNAEYRLPLWGTADVGADTAPAFLRRVYAAPFVDVGGAWALAPLRGAEPDPTGPGALRVGTGAELRADLTLGYALGATVRVGVARGLSDGGRTQPFLLLGSVF